VAGRRRYCEVALGDGAENTKKKGRKGVATAGREEGRS
jgi:hypothetical protein